MKVYYKRLIEGITIPAIIHNSSYFLINMPVYEDGTVDCWERVPLTGIAEKLKSGWLTTSVPENKSLSIHGLGDFCVKNADWMHNSESYLNYIEQTVKKLNRKMTGLFQETEEQSEKWKTHRTSWITAQTPYKISGNFGYTMIDGNSSIMFYNQGGAFNIVTVTGFADNTYQIDGGDIITAQEITNLIEQGALLCEPPVDANINIDGFGCFEVSKIAWSVNSGEKLKEILDYPNNAGDEETLHDRCVNLYYEYLTYPDDNNRERLREAYEAVPKHERMYLGDMDTKDADYRRILYTPNQKREV